MMILCLIFLSAQSILAQEYGLGDIPLPPEVYQRHLKIKTDRAIEYVELPAAYDARDEGIITPAKNQGSCGSCWAFACVGAMESHMLKAFNFGPNDLSEQQQVSCNTSMWGCSGGNSSAIRYWEQKGALFESCFPYMATESTICKEDSCDQTNYRVINWHTVSATTADFKISLFEDGPSYWRFDVYNDFYTYWSSGAPGDVYINASDTYEGGHAVLIIGWDDSKGAFLCKNSWGSTRGPNGDGTFWIAYSGHLQGLNFGMSNFNVISIEVVCGDGICDPVEENKCTCTMDCGNPPTVESICGDGLDNDCDNLVDCADPDCISYYACVCNNDGICEEGEDCHNCQNDCIRGDDLGCDNDTICEPLRGEDCQSCPTDCRGVLTGKPSGRYCCGSNRICGNTECNNGDWQCSMEQPVQYCCGDGVCQGEEDESNCATDCSITCTVDWDCDDASECTKDTCVNNICEYIPDTDGIPCTNGICCNGGCIAPACSADSDCDDFESCTADSCINGNTCEATCRYAWPPCGEQDGCCSPTCGTRDPDCTDCSSCFGGVCDGKCHPVKDGPGCPDCISG